MSERIYEKLGKDVKVYVKGKTYMVPETVFSITSFSGGIQFTTDSRTYEQFNKKEIENIIKILQKWMKER